MNDPLSTKTKAIDSWRRFHDKMRAIKRSASAATKKELADFDKAIEFRDKFRGLKR